MSIYVRGVFLELESITNQLLFLYFRLDYVFNVIGFESNTVLVEFFADQLHTTIDFHMELRSRIS